MKINTKKLENVNMAIIRINMLAMTELQANMLFSNRVKKKSYTDYSEEAKLSLAVN